MPIAQTRALVLGSHVLNEQDKWIQLLTENRGILKAVAPGALKSKNRFGSILELFTEGQFVYYWNEEKEMITLSKGDILNSFFNLISRPENLFHFYLMAEMIIKIIPSNQKDQRIFRLVKSVLEARKEDAGINGLLLYFQIWVLRIEGMMFNPDLCYNCFSRNLKEAWLKSDFRGILCNRCRTDEALRLSEADLRYIKWTRNHPPGEDFPEINPEHLDRLNRVFLRKLEYHGECHFNSKQYLPGFE
jgi:DNA repair protein RecO (recombination protein O)